MKKNIIVLFCIFIVFILVGCNAPVKYNGDYIVEEIEGEIVKGKDAMDAFYEQTKNGEKLELTYYRKYNIDGEEKSYSFYIKYDGEYYITNYKMYTNSPEESKYKYLVYSEEQGKDDSNIEKKEYYCLANNESHTYQVVYNSWFSAVFENHINDAMPFYDYTYYKNGFKLGSYSCNISLDGFGGFPSITFQNSYQYSFFYSITSSYIGFGNYKICDEYLYLIKTTSQSEEKIAFKIEKDALVFNLEKSTVESWILPDGTKFTYINEYDDSKYKLSVVDNHNILIEPLKEEYKAGEVVTVKLQFFSGIKAGIKANDELIETSIDSKVWEYETYQFIMPNCDTTLYTTINGYIESSKNE